MNKLLYRIISLIPFVGNAIRPIYNREEAYEAVRRYEAAHPKEKISILLRDQEKLREFNAQSHQ